MSVAGLILAAGQASRYGADKRLVRLADGRTMLETVLALYAQVCQPLLVVLRPHDEAAQAMAQAHGAQVLWCDDADQGMGRSLACGARVLLNRPDVSGVIVGLADMPFVSLSTLKRVHQVLQGQQQAVLPRHLQRPGHPRGLPRSVFELLRDLRGDEGARHAVDWQRAIHIEVDDPGILQDVDTPVDLATFQRAAAP